MISALNKKLVNDIWNIKGQMTAIVMVMAAGIAVFVIMFGVLDSLRLTQTTYYDRYQFADIFASLKRAPESIKKRISEIKGVSQVETRVTFGVSLQLPNMLEPASGRVLSFNDGQRSLLNNLYLRSGRLLFPNEEDAVVADESFVNAHNLKLGDKVSVIMNGHQRDLKIVGVVLSPEYVYSIAPGALMPDAKRYAIFWMSRHSLEAAVNMKGAFNDVSLRIERGSDIAKIKHQLDLIIKPYGGLVSYGRDEQLSNFFVENELLQLETLGYSAPFIFLSVAAFLINVVMSRLVATQREQIGMLKAVGYFNTEIIVHYLKMVLFITFFGALIGLLLGTWMAAGTTKMYTEFFHFPILEYSFSIEVMVFAVLSCVSAAIVGTLFAVKKVASLPPAEAMRPESPMVFKTSLLEKLGVHARLSFLTRIILRQLERRPLRALFSVLGMALAMSILIFSFFMEDSMDYLMEVQYSMIQREDVNLAFVEPRPYRALEEIKVIPGVLKVEPLRVVAVNLVNGHLNKKTSITGLVANADLRRVIDSKLEPVVMPTTGLILSEKLAGILGLKVGDFVEVEVLEEKRQRLNILVSGVTQEFIGLGAYMRLATLNSVLDQSPRINGVSIMVDQNHSAVLYQKLKKIPAIIGLNITSILRKIFEDIMAENMLKMMSTNIIFASFISFGVIYNTARIALSERGRELASLRVLGLTRREVAYLLFGELGLITLVSIPVGIWIGNLMVLGLASSMDSELYRIPTYLSRETYGTASLVVITSACLSFYLVWRQVMQIDLVSAQKGVE